MSDTQLLLDGPELAPLIERAREIGGRVVKAERVRKGFGPFARNGYVVTVDVPGLNAAPSTPAPRPATVPELTAGGAGPWDRAAGRGHADPEAPHASGLLGLEALLAVADGIDGPVHEDAGPRAVTPSTTTDRAATAGHATSDRASRAATDRAATDRTTTDRAATAGHATPDRASRAAADRAAGPSEPPPPPPPPPADRQGHAPAAGAPAPGEVTAGGRTEKRWSKPTWQRVERAATVADPAHAPGANGRSAGPTATAAPTTAAPATAASTSIAGSAAGSTADPSGRAGERSRRAGRRRPTPVPVDRAGPDSLASLGVPAALVAPAAVDWTTALMTFAAHLPRPVEAQLHSGSIVAVLGDPEPVRMTCAQMSARAGDLPVELVQVTGRPAPAGAKRLPPGRRRVGTPRSAGRLREERAGKLMLLTVETGGTETERETVREVLRVFQPDQVWLALDARGDRTELEDRLTVLPVDHVDAIAGQHAERARRPGVLLDLGLPLAWLDGLPATGVVWAHALDESLRWANHDGQDPEPPPAERPVRGPEAEEPVEEP